MIVVAAPAAREAAARSVVTERRGRSPRDPIGIVSPHMESPASPEASGAGTGTTGRGAAAIGDRRRWRARAVAVGLLAAIVALGTWGYRAIHPGRPDPEAVWAGAQADLRADRLDRVERAVALLGRLREPTPLDRMLRGQLATALGRTDEAIAELARVPDDHFMAAQARLLAGQSELRRDRFRHAEEALRAAVRIDPRLVQAHRELIYIYGYQLRRQALSEEFRALSRSTDLTPKELFHWGLLRNETWEPAEVAAELAKCVAADPDDRWSRLALAENQRRMGLFDQAEATVAPLPADDPDALAVRVRIALDRNDTAVAERLLASGPPDDPGLDRLRGRLALTRRDGAAAARYFRKAFRAQPESHEGLTGLIAALTILGDAGALAPLRDLAARRDRLQTLIQRAANSSNRDDPELPLLLGDACAALHRDDEARGWYKVVIARDPLNARAQRGLYLLGAGDGPDGHPTK